MQTRILPLCFSLLIGFPVFSLLKAQDKANLEAGAKIHQETCFRCHGKEGKADGPASKLLPVTPADWTDATRMADLSDDDLVQVIKEGGEAAGKSKLMPAFGTKLSDQEISDLVAFIRSLQGPAQ